MEKHILSKSTYIKGEQCLKQLYLLKKRPFLRDRMPAERIARFNRGTQVGIYAQQLFPGGIDAGPKHYSQYRKAVEKTAELIKQGREVIYEAAFQAHRTLILLDILVKNGDKWDAYEVKSSNKLSETFYKDAALQYYILRESGVNIGSFSLIHINTSYVRGEEMDIHKLFTITDVTEKVEAQRDYVAKQINRQLEILEAAHSPKIEIGPHCYNPYDCDFIGHCWKKVSSPSIFDIPALTKEEQFEIFGSFQTLETTPETSLKNDTAAIQLRSLVSQKEFVNKEELANYIPPFEEAWLVKILHFAPALPLYENTHPYQSLAFGFALQKINSSGEVLEEDLFIADATTNPCQEVKEKIAETINTDIPVFTYENNDARISGFSGIDLSELLKQGIYYHPKINKDYSSKSLAKALGIKPAYKSIDMDIVAAQYFVEIYNGHKDAEEKMQKIEKYFSRELKILSVFLQKLLKLKS